MKRVEETLLFLTLLFLPTQLGKHFWQQFSFIYSLKIDYLSPTIYFWDLLVLGLVGFWLINKPKINKLALNLLLIFLLSQALSLMGAQNIGAGLVRLEQYAVAGLFGLYLASNKVQIFLPLMLGVLFESGLAVLQFFKGGTLGLWILGERSFSITTPGIAKFNFYGLEFLRPYGTFPHPNVLAGYMLVMILILRSKKIAIAAITIFLTMSRATIFLGFIFLFKKNRKIFLILLIILSPILFTRFEALFSYDNLTFLRREELTVNAWNLFLKNPLFGVGLNNFIPSQEDLIAGPSRFLQPVHNIFLLALSETGIIGFLGFVILFFPAFKLSPKPLPCRQAGYTLVTIFFLGFFDHYFLTLPQGYRLLFLIWGLSLSQLKLK